MIGNAAWLKMDYCLQVGSKTRSKLKFLYFYPTSLLEVTMISPLSGTTVTMDSLPCWISLEDMGRHLTATLTHSLLSAILNI